MYCVYIIYSSTLNKFYIGYSSDFRQRLSYHNGKNRNRIWTKKGIPWQEWLIIGGLSIKQAAIGIERHIKRMKSARYIQNLRKYSEIIESLKEKYK